MTFLPLAQVLFSPTLLPPLYRSISPVGRSSTCRPAPRYLSSSSSFVFAAPRAHSHHALRHPVPIRAPKTIEFGGDLMPECVGFHLHWIPNIPKLRTVKEFDKNEGNYGTLSWPATLMCRPFLVLFVGRKNLEWGVLSPPAPAKPTVPFGSALRSQSIPLSKSTLHIQHGRAF